MPHFHSTRRFALGTRHTLRNKTCALLVASQYVTDLRALA